MLISPDAKGMEKPAFVSEDSKETTQWVNHHVAGSIGNVLIKPRFEGSDVVVTSPNNDKPLRFPISPSTENLSTIHVIMHTSGVDALDMGPEAEEWFTRACGNSTKLVYMPPDRSRPILGNVKPTPDQSGITFKSVKLCPVQLC
jgi:hypothetical protein